MRQFRISITAEDGSFVLARTDIGDGEAVDTTDFYEKAIRPLLAELEHRKAPPVASASSRIGQ